MSADLAYSLQSVSRFEKGVTEPLLQSISADLKKGQLIAIVGADGAGKTTLMRVMCGLLRPQEGSVKIFGRALYSSDLAHLQSLCGYMPQQFGLYADLSVHENLTLYADLFGLNDAERKERFAQLLAMTGLADFTARQAGRLSGGMKQKLGLACALLNRPKILLLDEPSVGVDPLSRKELWQILRENVRDGSMTVIVATTYMDEASLCDDVLMIEDGRVVLHDTPSAISLLAEDLCYEILVPDAVKVRDVQAQFLDDTDRVIDAVPRSGKVRVLVKKGVDKKTLETDYGYTLLSIEPGLEEGYLVSRHCRGDHSVNQHEGAGRTSVLACEAPRKSDQFPKARTQTKPVVIAKDLVRRFGTFTAVDKTSFDVYPGEIFGLLGPNGAGKTTTFKMLCGLLTVTSGALEVAGVNVLSAREEARERLGYMSQKFALYGDLSVWENLDFFASAYGLAGAEKRARIESLLGEFELSELRDRQAKSLSGGFKQRLAMAVALIHHPQLLFLDEPTSGADVPTRRQFWRWMTALSQAGTTVIVTTHFMEEALYCDRLLIQDAGRMLIMGTPEEVRGESATMDEAFIRVVEESRSLGGER